jgi:putative ABC transport system substrate-binding protein
MRRRELIAGLGGASVWFLAARAQPREPTRRIGFFLSSLAGDDPEGQARITGFVQRLQELGWTDGRNVRIDHRWGLGEADRLRKYAAELVALSPDVILAGGPPAVAASQQVTRTLPLSSRMSPIRLGSAWSPALRGPAEMPPVS